MEGWSCKWIIGLLDEWIHGGARCHSLIHESINPIIQKNCDSGLDASRARALDTAANEHSTRRTTMADKSIEQRVKEIIVEQLGVTADQVTPEAKFIEDLGADSLDIVELVMALEEEFGNEIPDEQAEKLLTVGDVVKYIEDTH